MAAVGGSLYPAVVGGVLLRCLLGMRCMRAGSAIAAAASALVGRRGATWADPCLLVGCLYVCMSVYPPICLTRGGLWQDLNGMITMLLAMVPPQFLVPHLPKSCDDWLAQGRARQQARRVGLCAATPARPLLPVLRYVVVDGTLPLCRRLGRAPVRTALLKGLMPCTVFC